MLDFDDSRFVFASYKSCSLICSVAGRKKYMKNCLCLPLMKACRWLYPTAVMVTNVWQCFLLRNITQVCVQLLEITSPCTRDFKKATLPVRWHLATRHVTHGCLNKSGLYDPQYQKVLRWPGQGCSHGLVVSLDT